MTTPLQRLSHLILASAATLVLLTCATPVRAQTVAVMVNGDPITDYDIEQRSKLDYLSTHKKMTRQEVIDELIDDKVKIKEAKQFSVDPTSSDIDSAYGEMSWDAIRALASGAKGKDEAGHRAEFVQLVGLASQIVGDGLKCPKENETNCR